MAAIDKLRATIATKDAAIKSNAATIKALQARLRTAVEVDECDDMDSDTELEMYRNAVARSRHDCKTCSRN